jgi:hypothetical protein
MPDSAALFQLIRGGIYRNPLGAELTALMPARDWDTTRLGPIDLQPVFGDIWIVEAAGGIFGGARHLATADGLSAYGYQLVPGATEFSDV